MIAPDSVPSARRTLSPLRLVLQSLGFALGLGLLVWCIWTVAGPENRPYLKKLADATAGEILSMVGLSLVVVLASGEVFRRTLAPVRRLPVLEVHAVNAVACLLALLPFKLSVLFRILVHNRRDGVPVLTIGAWLGAVAAVILCILGPLLAAGIWRGRADAAWFVTALGGMVICLTCLLFLARWLATDRGWERAKAFYSRLPLPARLRSGTPAAAAIQERSHEGVRMLASPRVVYGCAALRLIDLAAQAARIAIAAHIVGQPIHWEHAVLAGSIFFLITAAAPSGAIGAREGGTAWIISAVLPDIAFSRFAVVILTVSATEAAVLLVVSLAAVGYLHPARLLKRRVPAAS